MDHDEKLKSKLGVTSKVMALAELVSISFAVTVFAASSVMVRNPHLYALKRYILVTFLLDVISSSI